MRKNQAKVNHDARLRDSLPLMNDNDTKSVFPRIIIKRHHPLLLIILIMILILIILSLYSLFGLAHVDGHSMDNTLHNGEYVVLQKHQAPRHFDIVVLNEREQKNGSSKHIIKRVIGLPGDSISCIKGDLYINNKHYDEPYVNPNNMKVYRQLNWTIKVPKNHIFVLGDNRDISKDSRIVGSFKLSSIVGVKLFTFN